MNTPITLYSWNVNGLRACLKKGAFSNFIDTHHPDIICLQETKAQPGQAETDLPDYTEYWNSAERSGYSGTAIFTKTSPLNVSAGFTSQINSAYTWDDDPYGSPLREGRVHTAEFSNFYLVNVYTPNSKSDLSRLPLRQNLWDPAFLAYLQFLEAQKPVIVCGDFNAAHTEIDLARPKTNHHSAGFTSEERQGITNLISANFIDTFRHLHPSKIQYTWWSHWGKARANNVGWRIDYFFISQSLVKYLKSAEIHDQILGSDHCPISITLEF